MSAVQLLSDLSSSWLFAVASDVYNYLLFDYVVFVASGILLSACLLQQFWLLHGISLLIVGRIATVVFKWIVYALDDKELWTTVSYLNSWITFGLRESTDVLENKTSWKMAFFSGYVQQASTTGVAVVRYIYDQKMAEVRKEFIREMGTDRGRDSELNKTTATNRHAGFVTQTAVATAAVFLGAGHSK